MRSKNSTHLKYWSYQKTTVSELREIRIKESQDGVGLYKVREIGMNGKAEAVLGAFESLADAKQKVYDTMGKGGKWVGSAKDSDGDSFVDDTISERFDDVLATRQGRVR